MNQDNKSVLELANAAISKGDHEAFLSHCTDDITWAFVGDKTVVGKEAVRQYMAEIYTEPPLFDVENMIAEGDYVTAIGQINLKDNNGHTVRYGYCDVWQFREGKMATLKAFVIAV